MISGKDFDFVGEFNPVEAIKSAIVKHDEIIHNSQTIFGIQEFGEIKSICTRGNISCILGKAKSRKTFFISMVCASVATGELYEKFIGLQNCKITIFDTEQGRFHVQKVLKRILRLCELNGINATKNITVISLRPYSHIQRVAIIDYYFQKNNPDLVIIDGIRDLISDINNADQSTDITNQLMKWSELKNLHIINVLHMNKGDNNARGHLGTEIVNKSESVISVSKEKGSEYSSVEPEYVRGLDFDSFQFTVKDGLPVIVGKEYEIKRENAF